MSVPAKNTIWGEILYDGKIYGVLDGFHLNEVIWEKYNQYNGDLEECFKSTAPWTSAKPTWSIEEGKLYLTGLCREGLPTELFDGKRIFADWVSEMKLLVKHQKVCKTYERKNSYLNKMDILHLSLNQGNIVDIRSETEYYTSLEVKNYMDSEEDEIAWSSPYTTLRIESIKLLDYLEDKTTQEAEDEIFPVMSNLINTIIQKGSKEDVPLSAEDVKAVLNKGEVAVFASARGRDIDKMVASLTYSMTDEVLRAKGCLMHLTMNEDYPISNVENIVNGFENRLGFGKEDLSDAYFIFGTQMSNEINEGEVLIRVLLGI